jgi:hypothetical protein
MLRIAAAFAPDAVALLHAAGAAWVAAFLGLRHRLRPLLLRPRSNTQ